ncbi:MAG: helix-turn-helix transcriptional regulator [Blastocatellia bacterium]
MKRKGSPAIKVRFGLAIKKRRQELGFSQERLAELSGLHRTYVADIERGIRNVSLQNIEKLAKALGLPISALCAAYGVDK